MTWRSILPCGLALVACQVLPAQSTTTTTTTITTITAPTTVKVKQDLSSKAAGMLNHAGMAQDAIVNHDRAAVLQHLDEALGLSDQIAAEAPAHSGALTVPIYTEFDRVTWLAPVKGSARRGPAVIEGGVRASRMKKNTSVQAVEGNYTAMAVNVDNARTNLQAARAAIDNGDWQAAQADLAAVQSGIIQKTVSGDLPLLRARENLALARSRMLENKWHDVKAPLESAAQGLQDYTATNPGPHASEAESMRQDILHYAKDPDHFKSILPDRVNAWWGTLTDWFNAMVQ